MLTISKALCDAECCCMVNVVLLRPLTKKAGRSACCERLRAWLQVFFRLGTCAQRKLASSQTDVLKVDNAGLLCKYQTKTKLALEPISSKATGRNHRGRVLSKLPFGFCNCCSRPPTVSELAVFLRRFALAPFEKNPTTK